MAVRGPSLALALLLTACAACGALATALPPPHARGGRLWATIEAENALLFSTPTSAQWFPQRLDHFGDGNATFPQRFYEVDAFWRAPDGPVILSIGGEGSLDRAPQGFIQVLAQRFGAKIVALEHRFYGQSVPGDDLSTRNYRFLTVQQALADLAHFRDAYQRERMPAGGRNKWIAIGGSYPGALAAWFRVAYPNATAGALASSGVVLPVYAFHAFDEQVAAAVGDHCADALRRVTRAVEDELRRGNGTRVRALFGSRAGMEDADFLYMLADAAAMAVQYGHKDVLCGQVAAAVAAADADPGVGAHGLVEAFARFTADMYGRDFGAKCFYDTRCLSSEPARWGDDRSWRWQKCAQLAYFQVAPAAGSLRSAAVDLAYHERQCRAVFGAAANASEGVREVLALYGGDHPRDGHRIFFSNGADDPWQRASVLRTLVPGDEVADLAVCDLCGHCGDLGGNPNVPEPIKRQRELIASYLGKWLAEDDADANDLVAVASVAGVAATETAAETETETETETDDVHRSSPLVFVPIVLALAGLAAVLHGDLVIRDAPAHRYQRIGSPTHAS